MSVATMRQRSVLSKCWMALSVPFQKAASRSGNRDTGHNNIEMLLRDSGLLFRKLREFLDTWVVDARAEAAQSGHIPAQRRSAGPDAADRGGDAPAPTPTGLDA